MSPNDPHCKSEGTPGTFLRVAGIIANSFSFTRAEKIWSCLLVTNTDISKRLKLQIRDLRSMPRPNSGYGEDVSLLIPVFSCFVLPLALWSPLLLILGCLVVTFNHSSFEWMYNRDHLKDLNGVRFMGLWPLMCDKITVLIIDRDLIKLSCRHDESLEI